ncbi:hypothetical protein [Polaribacter butkevichii]|uniref:hypothetical protein n=1 Tax=Polaribacter butkevichii TaxID=218490 RepID=UPI0030F89079
MVERNLKEFKFTKRYYDRKYRIVKSKSAIENEEAFAERIDTLLKDKITPLTS